MFRNCIVNVIIWLKIVYFYIASFACQEFLLEMEERKLNTEDVLRKSFNEPQQN
jgi:hypothetical protein